MTADTSRKTSPSKAPLLSLDAWAVVIALALALVVKFGVLRNVPW
jgi:hypothetical protein